MPASWFSCLLVVFMYLCISGRAQRYQCTNGGSEGWKRKTFGEWFGQTGWTFCLRPLRSCHWQTESSVRLRFVDKHRWTSVCALCVRVGRIVINTYYYWSPNKEDYAWFIFFCLLALSLCFEDRFGLSVSLPLSHCYCAVIWERNYYIFSESKTLHHSNVIISCTERSGISGVVKIRMFCLFSRTACIYHIAL